MKVEMSGYVKGIEISAEEKIYFTIKCKGCSVFTQERFDTITFCIGKIGDHGQVMLDKYKLGTYVSVHIEPVTE